MQIEKDINEMICMRTGSSKDPKYCTKLNTRTRSGHRMCERMGVTQALDHTRYQSQQITGMTATHVREMGAAHALNHTKYQLEQKGHNACERMGATQALNHTNPVNND
ncbi:CTD small phosphatase-like protein 2 [Dorcoceras hygrometricum]|uniref:CTD small phosphatase-like protein 2 n=1 Tax=Dorcoceras hygrometricum TaxID=472368 RepID=A0A2Z7BQ54_9LAMI|nr:CTD small phosphatase-like protein 2 [Dorcoceras hygrometricum]